MLISYYEEGSPVPKKASAGMTLLIAANAVFAAVVLFAWTYVAFFVADPLSWATWLPISRGYGSYAMFEYPFVMLWFLPLVGIAGSWACLKAGRKVSAYAFAAVPIGMLTLILSWYYLAPSDLV